jgi:glycosyltransferase involved in cell wall biosynthesis
MDGLACYTESGARNCREAGIPKDRIFVFNNTLAPPPVLAGDIADIKDRAARERKRLGLGQAPVFLFIGRLYSEKRCALAAEAIALIHSSKGHPPHEHRPVLLVIGEGEDRPALERARDAGLPLVLAGEITDPVALAPLFHLSTALLAPDSLGLAIVQAFTAGLPVIVGPGRHHGPEIDYLCPGENGMIASHMTAAALAERAGLLLEDPDLLDRLRLGARTTAERLDMEVSVSVITRALLYGAGG